MGKGIFKYNKTNLIQVIVVLLIFTIANIFHYRFFICGMDFFEYSIWSWFLFFSYPLIFIQFIFQMCKLNEMRELMRVLYKCDIKIYSLYLQIDHRKQRKVVKYLLIFIVSWVAINVIQVTICHYFNLLGLHSMIQGYFYSLILLFENYVCFQFIVPSYQVRERFKLLNIAFR